MACRAAGGTIALVLFILLPSPARACSCIGGIPICETFWKTPVVFAGEVIDISPAPDPAAFADRRVRFTVERVWRGAASDTIDVMTSGSSASCGYGFQPGERYLVFTYDRGGTLWTGLCSATKRLVNAKEDLEYLNQKFPAADGGRVFGQAMFTGRSSGGRPIPVTNRAVTLRRGGQEWKATTNAEGNYEFTGIPAGTYEIALGETSTERVYAPRHIELADARGCATANFSVERVGIGDPGR
jgi:hypothetical protein